MNSMIDALLALSRLSSQPIARVPVNLSQLAGFVVDDLRREHPEREVEVEIEPQLLASGDPTLLRMLLENLLGNAWKYTGNTEHGADRLRAPRRRADQLHGARQRRRLRHALRRPPVRRLPAPAQRQRVPGHRRRPGVGAPHRPAPRRRDLGRVGARARRALSLHAAARAGARAQRRPAAAPASMPRRPGELLDRGEQQLGLRVHACSPASRASRSSRAAASSRPSE